MPCHMLNRFARSLGTTSALSRGAGNRFRWARGTSARGEGSATEQTEFWYRKRSQNSGSRLRRVAVHEALDPISLEIVRPSAVDPEESLHARVLVRFSEIDQGRGSDGLHQLQEGNSGRELGTPAESLRKPQFDGYAPRLREEAADLARLSGPEWGVLDFRIQTEPLSSLSGR